MIITTLRKCLLSIPCTLLLLHCLCTAYTSLQDSSILVLIGNGTHGNHIGMTRCLDSAELGLRRGWYLVRKVRLLPFDLLSDFFNSSAVVLFDQPQQLPISVAPIDLGRHAICVQTDCKCQDKPIEERWALTLAVATATCALSMRENALRGRMAWEDEGRLRRLHLVVRVLVSSSKVCYFV